MEKLCCDDIEIVAEILMPHEENFELTTNISSGSSLIKQNFATVLSDLESRLTYSQHNEVSKIVSASISKVIRDNSGDIISSECVAKVGTR